jgi:hypothetical protein
MKQTQFYKLNSGEYVNGRRILKVGRISRRTYSIVLKKIVTSRYPGKFTTYCSCDAKFFKKTKNKKNAKMYKVPKAQKN